MKIKDMVAKIKHGISIHNLNEEYYIYIGGSESHFIITKDLTNICRTPILCEVNSDCRCPAYRNYKNLNPKMEELIRLKLEEIILSEL